MKKKQGECGGESGGKGGRCGDGDGGEGGGVSLYREREKLHERKINDSYKSLSGKCPEEIQRVTNNPVIQKKVTIMPFSDESYSFTISSTKKVIK